MRRAWTYWRRAAAEARAEVGLAMSTSTRWALVAVMTVPWVAAFLAVEFVGTAAFEAALFAALSNAAVVIVGVAIFLVVLVGTPPRLDAELQQELDTIRSAPATTSASGEDLRIEITPGGPFTLAGRHDPEVAKEFIHTFGGQVASPEAPRSPRTSKRGRKSPPPSQAS